MRTNPRYAAVLARTNGRCGCRQGEPGACGQSHPRTGPHCFNSTDHGRLLVVAIDPTLPLHIAAGLGPDDLIALCSSCAQSRATTAKRAADAARADALAASQLLLFDAA